MKNEELLKSTNNLSTEDLNLLREKFVGEYVYENESRVPNHYNMVS